MELQKPYYAVIFTSIKTNNDAGYIEMAQKMERLAKEQPGFLGFETASSKVGISISYWESQQAIAAWKANADHQMAQITGKQEWYSWYKVRVCLVEREYNFGTKT